MLVRSRFDEVRKVTLKWLNSIMDCKVVELEDGSPRPNPPFLGFKLVSEMSSLGVYDEQGFDGDTFRMKGFREFTIHFESVEATRNSSAKKRATDRVGEIQFDLDSPLVGEQFRKIGVAVIEKGIVVDFTKVLETDFEPRAILDSRFNISLEKDVSIGAIDIVEIDGDVDSGQGGDPDHKVDLTVP